MSSRTRPRARRGSINRERIVDAAVEIADTDGIHGLSMPKLARRLDVGVMSLYGHVLSKDDLVEAVAQRLLEEVPAPDTSLPWDEAIREHFRSLRRTLVAHPGLGDTLATRALAVPAVSRILEQNLSVLRAGGLAPESAAKTYCAMLTYTLGFVSWELPRHGLGADEYLERWDAVFRSLPSDQYPMMHELREPLARVASDEQYEFGLAAFMR